VKGLSTRRSARAAAVAAVAALAAAAVAAGAVVVFPADTVYGLGADPSTPAGRDALYELKGRPAHQPTALMVPTVDVLLELLPELPAAAVHAARALLPGPYTLVLPNPAGRFPWLCGTNLAAIGVRVPALRGAGGELLDAVRALAATSANLRGGPEPRRLDDVPRELREAAAAVVDGGELPGTPSTVIDFTGPEPRVLREGAGSVEEALGRASAAAA
jgi:L-threonylcarbamoyladenylate synthase